jgi:predicted helicase
MGAGREASCATEHPFVPSSAIHDTRRAGCALVGALLPSSQSGKEPQRSIHHHVHHWERCVFPSSSCIIQFITSSIFPAQAGAENIVICTAGPGATYQTFLAANRIVDVKCGISGNSATQCFPYYTYAEDGSNRRENITDWALEQFQAQYGLEVGKWDIFHYIYAILHHPHYRERYSENLKRDLPHIPLLSRSEAYQAAVRIGQALMDLHVKYEQQEPYPLTLQEDPSVPFSRLCLVEKMKLTPDRAAVIVNKGLTLGDVPVACFRYLPGNRSALEWVIDQYQVSKDVRSGIVSDPNNPNDPEYIVRLIKQVVTVSVRTVELVDRLAQEVKPEDWQGETNASE